jgi:hypothetical protein
LRSGAKSGRRATREGGQMIAPVRRPRLWVATIAVTLTTAACSGDVGGTVFVKMQSGDIKRGADVEVVLVGAGDQFEAEWKKGVTEYQKAEADANVPYVEAQAVQTLAHQEYLKDIMSNSKQAQWEASTARVLESARKVDEVRRVHRDHAVKLVQWGKKATTRTSVEGRYEFTGVKTGRYYVFARYQDANNILYWVQPVEVKGGTQRVDLSNSNAGWPFSEQ